MRGASRAPNPSEPLPHSHSHTAAQILPPLNRQLAGQYYHFGAASSNAIDNQPDTVVVKPLVSSAAISLLLCCFSSALLPILLIALNLCPFLICCTFGNWVSLLVSVKFYFCYDFSMLVNYCIGFSQSRSKDRLF